MGNNNELIKGETVRYVGRVSLWTQSHLIMAGLMVLAFTFLFESELGDHIPHMYMLGIGISLLCFVAAYLRYLSNEIIVTNLRIIVKSGILMERTNELNMNKTESLQVVQSIAGRMCNYGSVTVSGTGGDHALIHGLSNPQQLRRAFIEAQNPVHN